MYILYKSIVYMFICFSPEKGLHKNRGKRSPRRRCLHGALGEVFRDQQRQDAAAPGIALGNRNGDGNVGKKGPDPARDWMVFAKKLRWFPTDLIVFAQELG